MTTRPGLRGIGPALAPVDAAVAQMVDQLARHDTERYRAVQDYVNTLAQRMDAALTGLHGDLANVLVRWEAAQRVLQREAPALWTAVEREVSQVVAEIQAAAAAEGGSDGAGDSTGPVHAPTE